MPDTRQHRGRDPRDDALFSAERLPLLRTAVADLSWLLGRGYSQTAALKLVGDRHELRNRQRLAVLRSACSDEERDSRQSRRLPLLGIAGRPLAIDGFNCLITIEAALSGGLLLRGRDGVLRDLSSVHGSYRDVQETDTALAALVAAVGRARPAEVRLYLDRPVSNSGRLRALIEAAAAGAAQPWAILLADNPDREMVVGARAEGWVLATGDAPVLDACGAWTPLAEDAVTAAAPAAWLVDLSA